MTITTLHQAKGLEFEVVFIADAVEGVFPDLRTQDSLLGVRHLPRRRTPRPAGVPPFPPPGGTTTRLHRDDPCLATGGVDGNLHRIGVGSGAAVSFPRPRCRRGDRRRSGRRSTAPCPGDRRRGGGAPPAPGRRPRGHGRAARSRRRSLRGIRRPRLTGGGHRRPRRRRPLGHAPGHHLRRLPAPRPGHRVGRAPAAPLPQPGRVLRTVPAPPCPHPAAGDRRRRLAPRRARLTGAHRDGERRACRDRDPRRPAEHARGRRDRARPVVRRIRLRGRAVRDGVAPAAPGS